jgi:hypothetical protein
MLRDAAQAAQRAVRHWFREEGQENIGTSSEEQATFVLQFGALVVGTLQLLEGHWEFNYSEAFRSQLAQGAGVQPLVEFPDVTRTYRSPELWPFFQARIPSVSQPRVLEEIERKGLDQRSAAELLKAFGERSIANPFLLKSA